MSPRVIVFDLLTALLDSWSLWNAAAGDDTAGRRWRTRYLEITFGSGAYQPYERLVEQSASETGLSSAAAATLLASWDQLQPWPEVPEVLESLKARGYRIAVVTNCSSQLGHRAAVRCGVPFDAVVTAEESGFYKPHPKAYQAILDALGVTDPSDALFVAGSNGDVTGAAAAGMPVVWHNRVGLPMLPGSAPLVEGQSLRQVLREWLGYKGLQRSEISTPTLYLNRRKFADNCKRMHDRAAALNAKFRVHIKTHKTIQGTEEELRHGDGRIVCSTLKEIEFIEPLVRKGTVRSILYGVPPAKSYIRRLALLKKRLKVEFLLMIDHPSQISLLQEQSPDEKWSIFIKIDCGTRRAGLEPESQRLNELIQTGLEAENVNIYGFYCHSGHSYASSSLQEAEGHLIHEIASAASAAKKCLSQQPNLELTVSVGATPTAHAASASVSQQLKDLPGQLELHAGNYALLDLQQVDTNLVTLDQVSSWIEVEVCSVYLERHEILVNVGCLGLGREPGREPGVWGRAKILDNQQDGEEYPWNVVRLSQEHGILAPRTSDPTAQDRMISEVKVGSRVRIIPQHACIVGAMYESYIVVDDDDGVCVDEWVRCRGW
ncbi:hypothetical protein VTN96DRAFT_2673 [Rasamsonia emersonii]|uniref:D-serine dehydratase n=1 Tax=Rasamsonia emersonii (strain ATCC 16479 / CBS 393.64 / IMI 116815) TaxID=1408163 RepID=A0A0F4YEY3_RASE3|nr:hypothetical protein T310_9675 [Rasamsonia emersonii CBS 393.64]KKA16694.1 hypothetical protein T310_9675 [Rasamsonia emersonii CBS 393.64]